MILGLGCPLMATVTVPRTRGGDPDNATTQGEEIEWQTQALTLDLMRDDSPNRRWKRVGAAQETEVKAEEVVKALLNIEEGP